MSFFWVKTCHVEIGISVGDALSREAIIWKVGCVLKYSNTKFFGIIDKDNEVYGKNPQSVPNSKLFPMALDHLLNRLTSEIVSGQLYATGSIQVTKTNKRTKRIDLYSLVECTRDLSHEDCKKCLHVAISELQGYSQRMSGGRVIYGSCYVRLNFTSNTKICLFQMEVFINKYKDALTLKEIKY